MLYLYLYNVYNGAIIDEEEKEGSQPDYADREYTYEEVSYILYCCRVNANKNKYCRIIVFCICAQNCFWW